MDRDDAHDDARVRAGARVVLHLPNRRLDTDRQNVCQT